MATPTPAQLLPHVQNPNILQRWALRREIIDQGGGDMTPALDRQIRAMGAACTEADLTAMIGGSQAAFALKAGVVAQGLITNEGADAMTATSGPIITFITQLLQTLLPMLIACIPAA